MMDRARLLSILRTVFGKTSFRSCQEEIIRAVLQGYDVLVLLPTGHGKSLTYQLPAVANEDCPGVTIVVSPLISLMKNQVHDLLGNDKINAVALNGQTSSAERNRILMDLASSSAARPPSTRLLYVSPELCATDAFRKVLTKLWEKNFLARFVIDEAHCCVEWGLDFRTSYKELAYLRDRFPDTPITALTATASDKVQQGIISMLKLDKAKLKTFSTSVNRPNIHYEVKYFPAHDYETSIIPSLIRFLKEYKERREKIQQTLVQQITEFRRRQQEEDKKTADGGSSEQQETEEQQEHVIQWWKQRKSSGSGVIYCRKKSTVELVAQALQAEGFGANAYHAGLPQSHRDDVLTNWLDNTPGYEIVVATVAFGMGIDKEDVRFVIHVDLPGSVESYYQASGRAGRDGKGARCILYYSREDRDRVLSLNRNRRSGWDNEDQDDDGNPRKRRRRQMESSQDDGAPSVGLGLRWLVQYCENTTTCRHLYLCGYFEKDVPQTPAPEWCHYACDYCKDPRGVSRRSMVLAEENFYQFYY